jgi:hypothetical protein
MLRAEEPGSRPPSMSHMESGQEPEASSEHDQPRWSFWLFGAAVVTAVLVLSSALSPWVRHEWALSLGRQETPYTQLGFTRAASLPTSAVRGKGIPISFVIANDEGKQVSYRYVVASGSGATLKSLTSATEVVAAGESRNVSITVVPKCVGTTCRVQVSLPQQGESIDFMFTYPAKSSTKGSTKSSTKSKSSTKGK